MNWNWLNHDMFLTVALWMQSYLLRKWKKNGERKILVYKGYQYFITECKLLLKSMFAEREREREIEQWVNETATYYCVWIFFPTSPAIAKCSMKKFIRVFMPFSEYISDSRTHPLPTTISRNSDVSITNWGTYKMWTKNTKPN